MQEKIKDIVSAFIKVSPDQIGPATAIGRTAVKNSILLHRMYARLQEEGIVVSNYSQVQTFSDLLEHFEPNGNGQSLLPATAYETSPMVRQDLIQHRGGFSIGIDIEEIAAMPVAHDFRKDAFYQMNFSPSEIAYCILQPDAYASFAGLFTAKEALVKAGVAAMPFHSIEIAHTPEGKPVFPGFQVSISHAGTVAVAVAAPSDVPAGYNREGASAVAPPEAGGQKGSSLVLLLSILALLTSILAIVFIFTR
jgi:phosphopantetheine--protein transferase-like protein